MQPILELLSQLRIADYLRRDVATVDEFEYYIAKWQQKRYEKFQVLYLAMHGSPGSLSLGRDTLTLDDLEEVLHGSCSGTVIYFGACSTLRDDPKRLQQFAAATGARAVVGYRKDVDWLDCAAFEVLLLERLTTGLRSDAVFNRLVSEHGSFARSLGLVVATKQKVYTVPQRAGS